MYIENEKQKKWYNIIIYVNTVADAFCEKLQDKENQEMRDLLEDVSYNIMKIAVKKELGEDC